MSALAVEVRRTLREAAALVREGWTQETLRRDVDGVTCRCAEGAILDASGRYSPLASEALDALRAHIGVRCVAVWNDAPERTQAEVVAALEAAADCAVPS